MPLEDFAVPSDWIRDLDNRWPERVALKTYLVDELFHHIAAKRGTPRILELGIGDGDLLLQLYDKFPTAKFVAVDIKPVLLEFVAERFDSSARVTFIEQDLSANQWSAVGGGFDVIYTLQSFHDLGGRAELSNSYQQCLDMTRAKRCHAKHRLRRAVATRRSATTSPLSGGSAYGNPNVVRIQGSANAETSGSTRLLIGPCERVN